MQLAPSIPVFLLGGCLFRLAIAEGAYASTNTHLSQHELKQLPFAPDFPGDGLEGIEFANSLKAQRQDTVAQSRRLRKSPAKFDKAEADAINAAAEATAAEAKAMSAEIPQPSNPGGAAEAPKASDEMPTGGDAGSAFPEDVMSKVPGFDTMKDAVEKRRLDALKKNMEEPGLLKGADREWFNYGDDFVPKGKVSKTRDVERRIEAGYTITTPSDMECLEADAVDLYAKCGPAMVTKCQCEAMGCCWGEDNPYYDLLVRDRYEAVPTCHRKRAGAPSMTDMSWSVMARQPSSIMINGLLNGEDSRFMITSAMGTCQGGASIDGTAVLPIAADNNQVELQVTIQDPGEYRLCMGSKTGANSGEIKGTFGTNVGSLTAHSSEALIPGCPGAPGQPGYNPDPDNESANDGNFKKKLGKKQHSDGR